MVLIEKSRNDAEANIAVTGTGAAAQQRVVPKHSLEYMITFAYVFHQLEKRLAPCVTVQSIMELAAHLSTHMQLVVPRQRQLVVPRQQLIEPPPAQMLRFTKEIPAEIFTNDTIDLQIELVNSESGFICSTGEPSSPLQVEIFVTRGDFPSNDKKHRTCEPLRQRERAHKLPLLVQATCTQTARRRGLSFKNTFVAKMHNGRAVAKVKITDNSSWVRSKMFKLVARVKGRRIKEALSEAFAVKESKLKGKKADVPSPTDPTSKLNYVGNKSYEILQAMGINTVQDFLNKLESDPEGLKATVGMQNTKWESTVNHARQCIVSLEQVMGQQRDPVACFGSDYSNPNSSLNGNNGSLVFCSFPSTVPMPPLPISRSTASYGPHPGEVFGEMPEQASTGQGMTMVNGSNLNQGLISNFPGPESNQLNFYAGSPSNDYQPLWNWDCS